MPSMHTIIVTAVIALAVVALVFRVDFLRTKVAGQA